MELLRPRAPGRRDGDFRRSPTVSTATGTTQGDSDYAFLNEVNRLVEESLCVDTDLRFAIGFSWGASMSVALACGVGEYPLRAATAIGAAGPFECKLANAAIEMRHKL